MENYNSFIYMWIDRLKEKFYIGSHFGKIDDGYLFGGIDIKSEYRLRPNDFERVILSYHLVEKHSDIRLIEKEYLLKFDVENNEKFYNRTNESYGGTHQKSIIIRLNDLDENGLNSFQRSAKKMVATRKLKGNYKTAKIKEYQTKKSNINDFEKTKSKISNTLKGSKWINKDGKILYIKKSEYEKYINDGWKDGLMDSSYEICKLFAKEMKIKSAKHWYEISKKFNLPVNPNVKFKNDWISWEEFLGKEKMIKEISFQECKKLALSYQVKSQKEWQIISKKLKLPYNPNRKYKKNWISWYDFLDKRK